MDQYKIQIVENIRKHTEESIAKIKQGYIDRGLLVEKPTTAWELEMNINYSILENRLRLAALENCNRIMEL